jgi:hypothetical protein
VETTRTVPSDEAPLSSSSVVNENEHQEPQEPQLSLIQPEEEAEDQNEMNYEQIPQQPVPLHNNSHSHGHPVEQEDYPRREPVNGEEDDGGIKITETTISMIVNNIDENEEYPPVEEDESIAENSNLTSSKSFVIPQDSNGDNIQVSN